MGGGIIPSHHPQPPFFVFRWDDGEPNGRFPTGIPCDGPPRRLVLNERPSAIFIRHRNFFGREPPNWFEILFSMLMVKCRIDF